MTPTSSRPCSAPWVRSSTSAAPNDSSPPRSGRPSSCATSTAGSPAAGGYHWPATPTTSTTGPTEARPASTTWCCSAAPTTPSSTPPPGRYGSTPSTADLSSGHRSGLDKLDHPRNRLDHPRNRLDHPNIKVDHPRNRLDHPRNKLDHPRNELDHPKRRLDHPKRGLDRRMELDQSGRIAGSVRSRLVPGVRWEAESIDPGDDRRSAMRRTSPHDRLLDPPLGPAASERRRGS